MLFNDLPLPVSQFIFRFRILQRSCRMVESVQPVRIFLIRLMPVIQKIIVKQCPSYQISSAVFHSQQFRKCHTVPRHLNAMLFHGYTAVLHIIFTAVKIFGVKNIPGIPIQFLLNLFLFFKILPAFLPFAFLQIYPYTFHFISLSSDTIFLSLNIKCHL